MIKKKKIRFSSKKVSKAIDFINKGIIFDIFNPTKTVKNNSFYKKLRINLPKYKTTNLSTKESIPTILFKTGKVPKKDLPIEIHDIFDQTLKSNPEFKIEYYSDHDSLKFIKTHFDTKVVNTYKKLKPGAYKADLFRYCVLYIKGGIYGDLTQQYKVSISDIVDFKRDTLVLVRDRVVGDYRTNGIQISFIAAVKGLSLFKEAIDQIVDNVSSSFYGYTPLDPTGPYLFRNVFQNYKGDYRLELEFDKNGKQFIRYIRTGKIAIINKLPNHNNLTNTKKNTHYSYMWHTKNIYD